MIQIYANTFHKVYTYVLTQ